MYRSSRWYKRVLEGSKEYKGVIEGTLSVESCWVPVGPGGKGQSAFKWGPR